MFLKNSHKVNLFRLTPSEFQHWGSSLKGTSSIQGGAEVSDIKASRGHCPFSKLPPHSWQAGALSETPSTWLTLFDPPWISPGIPFHPTQLSSPLKLLFHRNGWSWLILYNFPNPLKQATAGLSEPRYMSLAAASPDSQLGFTWKSPSPAQVAAISYCFISSGRVAPGKT